MLCRHFRNVPHSRVEYKTMSTIHNWNEFIYINLITIKCLKVQFGIIKAMLLFLFHFYDTKYNVQSQLDLADIFSNRN